MSEQPFGVYWELRHDASGECVNSGFIRFGGAPYVLDWKPATAGLSYHYKHLFESESRGRQP